MAIHTLYIYMIYRYMATYMYIFPKKERSGGGVLTSSLYRITFEVNFFQKRGLVGKVGPR